jgi:hypothetical protein
MLAPLGATATAQQVQERPQLGSPMKVLRKALDRLRNPRNRQERARAAGTADESRRPRGDGTAGRDDIVARLPKPRPASGPSPVATEAFPDAGEMLENSAAMRTLFAEQPPEPARVQTDLDRMPKSFASAGIDAAPSTLPVPDGVPQPGSALTSEEPPAMLDPVEDDLLDDPPDTQSALDLLIRVPRPRPEPSRVMAMVDPQSSAETAGPPVPHEVEPEDPACLGRLRELGVAFSKQPPLQEGACFVAHPLKVTSLGSGVAITPEALLNCRTTEALALWVRDSLVPAARTFLHAMPNEIAHGSTYVCRTRNNVEGAKTSEHASANAVDIASIGFAGRPPVDITAFDEAAPEGRFSTTIRKESCTYFTTVLGPGSNAAHASHFHFDMAERRGGYRLCDLGGSSTVERTSPKT